MSKDEVKRIVVRMETDIFKLMHYIKQKNFKRIEVNAIGFLPTLKLKRLLDLLHIKELYITEETKEIKRVYLSRGEEIEQSGLKVLLRANKKKD